MTPWLLCAALCASAHADPVARDRTVPPEAFAVRDTLDPAPGGNIWVVPKTTRLLDETAQRLAGSDPLVVCPGVLADLDFAAQLATPIERTRADDVVRWGDGLVRAMILGIEFPARLDADRPGRLDASGGPSSRIVAEIEEHGVGPTSVRVTGRGRNQIWSGDHCGTRVRYLLDDDDED